MIRRIARLISSVFTPVRARTRLGRRVLAALALYGFAVGSSLFWNNWRIDWPSLSVNLAAASIGLYALHARWRKRENTAMTPARIRDTFS